MILVGCELLTSVVIHEPNLISTHHRRILDPVIYEGGMETFLDAEPEIRDHLSAMCN